MRNSVETANAAAAIKAVSVSTPVLSTAATPLLLSNQTITYTTKNTHQFKVGQSVTVRGLFSSGTTESSLSVKNSLIVGVPSGTKFTVYVPGAVVGATSGTTLSSSGITVTSTATAVVSNGWANLTKLKFSTPEPIRNTPYSFNITGLNITADTSSPGSIHADDVTAGGKITYILTWGVGSGDNANPPASYVITQTGYSSTTVATTSSPTGTTSVDLVAGKDYTFTITASNSVGSAAASAALTVGSYVDNVTSLAYSDTSGTAGSIDLTWAAPTKSAPPMSTSGSKYYIQRRTSTDNGLTWSDWGDLSGTVGSYTQVSGSLTATTDASASAPNTKYDYQIKAFNTLASSAVYIGSGGGVSPYYLTSPLPAPTVDHISGTSSISISSISYISNPAVSAWTISRATSTDFGSTWGSFSTLATTSSLPYTDASVSLNTTYKYKLAATNGTLTATSPETSSILTYNVPTAPTNLTAQGQLPLNSTINPVLLSWTPSTVNSTDTPVTSYTVVASSNTSFSSPTILSNNVTGNTFNDTQTSGTRYYKVYANNVIGVSASSSSVVATATSLNITVNSPYYPDVMRVSGSVSPTPSGGTVTIYPGGVTAYISTSGALVTTTVSGTTAIPLTLQSPGSQGVFAYYNGTDGYRGDESNTAVGTVQKGTVTISMSFPNASSIGGVRVWNNNTSQTLLVNMNNGFIGGVSGKSVTLTGYDWRGFVTTSATLVTDASGNATYTVVGGSYEVLNTVTWSSSFAGDSYYNSATASDLVWNTDFYVRSIISSYLQLGSTSNGYNYGGNADTNQSQAASSFSIPTPSDTYYQTGSLRVQYLSAKIAGYGGDQAYVVPAIWEGVGSTNSVIVSGSAVTVPSAAAGSTNYVTLNFADTAISPSHTYLAGFWRRSNSASYTTQWSYDTSTSYNLYYDNNASSVSTFNKNDTFSGYALVMRVYYYYWA